MQDIYILRKMKYFRFIDITYSEQRNHYYPFGAIYGDLAYNDGLQKYKYNGKELDHMHGLNFYDYGARQYDPLLGMFTQMDPLAEKYYGVNPYAYCGNSPINAIDNNGERTKVDRGTVL